MSDPPRTSRHPAQVRETQTVQDITPKAVHLQWLLWMLPSWWLCYITAGPWKESCCSKRKKALLDSVNGWYYQPSPFPSGQTLPAYASRCTSVWSQNTHWYYMFCWQHSEMKELKLCGRLRRYPPKKTKKTKKVSTWLCCMHIRTRGPVSDIWSIWFDLQIGKFIFSFNDEHSHL